MMNAKLERGDTAMTEQKYQVVQSVTGHWELIHIRDNRLVVRYAPTAWGKQEALRVCATLNSARKRKA